MMKADGTVNTRQAAGPRNLVKPRANLDVRTNFFSVRVVDTWDAIPTDIKMAKDQRKFLKNVQEPQTQLQGDYRCWQGVRDGRHQVKRAAGPHNRSTCPAEEPTTSIPK
jgi:hypothetical protein